MNSQHVLLDPPKVRHCSVQASKPTWVLSYELYSEPHLGLVQKAA